MIHLIRSQIAAVVGNITSVIPTVIAIHLLFTKIGYPFLDAPHAHAIIQSFSVLGMTPFYAVLTGALLWASSVVGGWFGNWVNYQNLPSATEHDPKLNFFVGQRRAHRLAQFLKQGTSSLVANLSLALFLGMTPPLGQFFGIPLDVRHVTLSTGALTAAVMTLGPSSMHQLSFC